MQEVLRLLGVRNLTGNAEHCLNAGAVHNEILTGQEGPFLTMKQAVEGPDRFYLLNGWNRFVTHPPVFAALQRREELDAYLVEVAVSESAKALAKELGPDRILLVRPRSDPHLALAVANEILREYPEAIDRRFLERFADDESFRRFTDLASSPTYEPQRVAARIAPEPAYEERLYKGASTRVSAGSRAGSRRRARLRRSHPRHPRTVPLLRDAVRVQHDGSPALHQEVDVGDRLYVILAGSVRSPHLPAGTGRQRDGDRGARGRRVFWRACAP
jgi:anaerobic selenocysteine-containing dehydrogenase